MEQLKAKAFFKSIRDSYRELASLTEERDRLFGMLTSTTIKQKEVDVQTSISGDKMSEVVPKMMELDELINDQIQQIVEKQIQAEKIIRRIDSIKYRETLRWYYVENLKWHEVAERMNYDIYYIQKLNGRALEEAEKFFDIL